MTSKAEPISEPPDHRVAALVFFKPGTLLGTATEAVKRLEGFERADVRSYPVAYGGPVWYIP